MFPFFCGVAFAPFVSAFVVFSHADSFGIWISFKKKWGTLIPSISFAHNYPYMAKVWDLNGHAVLVIHQADGNIPVFLGGILSNKTANGELFIMVTWNNYTWLSHCYPVSTHTFSLHTLLQFTTAMALYQLSVLTKPHVWNVQSNIHNQLQL